MLSVLGVVGGQATESDDVARGSAFSIQQQGSTSWLVGPDGRRFFSLGVCCVNQGVSPGEFDPANPGYAAWRHYADSNQWTDATLGRLKAWGFTTVGGWSDFPSLRQRREHPGGTCGTRVSSPAWTKSRANRSSPCATTRA